MTELEIGAELGLDTFAIPAMEKAPLKGALPELWMDPEADALIARLRYPLFTGVAVDPGLTHPEL